MWANSYIYKKIAEFLSEIRQLNVFPVTPVNWD